MRVSPDSLFAALITCGDKSTISVGQASTAAASFRVPLETLSDAAFFDGKLYAISHSNKLFVLDIDSSDQGTTTSRPFRKGYDYTYWRYLVESGGRLLQIRRLAKIPSFVRGCDRVRRYRTISFDIFEADLTNSSRQWTPVNTLGGQALFVGTYSKSLPASECGAREDCVYFMCDYDSGYYDKDPFHDCGLFHIGNGMITPLLPNIAVVPTPGKTVCKGRPAWFFHTETIMADATKH
ncbi:hypothetical protein C2845_PM05G28150 [Panicum miliaceum]|uniref:KIB1-4 beta-propeller domain-containing protein n=1 Tax=Panicum miliaceum TaxID=4540 RepID=A0A3L6T629_PANMI|nr:hypothetical protein C2845_PM05G28150 [Panicum miliaceum]